MFCVMWFVSASSSIDPSAAQTIQKSRRTVVGGSASASSGATAAGTARRARHAQPAQAMANST